MSIQDKGNILDDWSPDDGPSIEDLDGWNADIDLNTRYGSLFTVILAARAAHRLHDELQRANEALAACRSEANGKIRALEEKLSEPLACPHATENQRLKAELNDLEGRLSEIAGDNQRLKERFFERDFRPRDTGTLRGEGWNYG